LITSKFVLDLDQAGQEVLISDEKNTSQKEGQMEEMEDVVAT
jgi:hypothetical protein